MKRTTKFQPGRSGNPKGRPRGSCNRSTKLIKAIEKDLPELIRVTTEKALAGDMTAMRLILERVFPLYRAVAPPADLPEMEQSTSLTERAKAVMLGIGRGQIAPDIGSQLIAAIGSVAKVAEIDEIERRIRALEEQRGSQS